MRESEVKREIKARLEPVGWVIIDTSLPRGGYKQLEGIPDLLCWRYDHFVTIEAKQPGGKVRDSQIKFLELVAPHLGNHVYHYIVPHPDLIPNWMVKEHSKRYLEP